MATKKAAEDKPFVVEKKAAETPYDPWERVEVFIPRGQKGEDPNYYVSVNDYTALLPKGQSSMVPRFVKEEIDRSRAAENAFWDYSESREIDPNDKALK